MEHAPAWLTYTFLYLAAAVIAVPISRALGLGTMAGGAAALNRAGICVLRAC